MENKVKNYLFLILFHVLLGVVIYMVPLLSKAYGILIFLVSLYFIIKTRNRNNEVLYAAAYVVGSEVFLRMTDGNPNHEFSKYSVIIFMIMGMIYSGFSKNAVPYWIFLILLIPGIVIATQSLGYAVANVRKTILFNISGPLTLGIASLYCYYRRLTIFELNNILLLMGLPIISCSIYLILYTPDLKEILTTTVSNSETSGGFGPNQVSTALGLGMFIFFTRVFVASKNKLFFFLNILLAITISYRGLITFSRGGMVTGALMIALFMMVAYMRSNKIVRTQLIQLVAVLLVAFSLIWVYAETETSGLIGKRYANKDALGREKESKFTGREALAAGEVEMFLENPFFGVGAGKGTEIRTEQMGYLVASHDELTRMLAEHGMLGILALLILLFTPIILYLDNKQHLYLFCFIAFWFLTINHAAMRTAAPSFVYALALLKIRFTDEEEVVIRRK
ncbi:O-antigen ligase family protein [Flavobacterium sp.]|uniref:O-antigen ligase family protein n=1 Tax=Flavobacterium sp. TaxID=239 RepID=UPI002602255A|nr:O-antigen ligase family protein [Flavobacterium sp.]